jgi:hypothetical protein
LSYTYSFDFGNTGTFLVSGSSSATHDIPEELLYDSGLLPVRGRITNQFGAFTDYFINVPVANQAPSFATVAQDRTVHANSLVTLTGISFADPGRDLITATINWGDGTITPGLVTTTNTSPAPTTGVVTGSHVYAYRAEPYNVTVTVHDRSGATAEQSFKITVVDPPITVGGGSDRVVSLGSVVTLDSIRFSDPTAPAPGGYIATVDWGDDTGLVTVTVNAPDAPLSLGSLLGSHVYAEEGTYTVTAAVTKGDQAAVSTSFQTTVQDVGISLDAGSDWLVSLGSEVTLDSVRFIDPTPRGASSYVATVDWGDGTSPVSLAVDAPASADDLGTLLGSYVYAEEGTYTVTVSVTKGIQVPVSAAFEVTVANAVLTVSGADDQTILTGQQITLDAVRFTDSLAPSASGYTATVDWGDQTDTVTISTVAPATPDSFGTLSGSYAYAQSGSYTVTMLLNRGTQALASATFQVTVEDAVVSLDMGTDRIINEGGQVTLDTLYFTDTAASLFTTHTATVNWGDGTDTLEVEVDSPITPNDFGRLFGSHYYGQDGEYTVTVSLQKGNQGVASGTFQVMVNDVAPTVQFDPIAPAGPGVPIDLKATFSDPSFPVLNNQEIYTATIHWGDGNTSEASEVTVEVTLGSPGVPTYGTIAATHQYSGNGPYTVTLILDDGVNTSLLEIDALQVINAPPTVTPVQAQVSAEAGESIIINAAFSDLGFDFGDTIKSFIATVDWGDGLVSEAVVTVTPGDETTPTTGMITASHIYATFGTFPIVVQVTDEGGAVGEAAFEGVVENLAPSFVTPPSISYDSATGAVVLSGSFTDSGWGDSHAINVDWGDGTTSYFTATESIDLFAGASPSLGGLTQTTPGQFSISHVYTEKPVVTSVSSLSTPQSGLSFSGPVATFYAANDDIANFRAEIQWGDGTTTTVLGSEVGGIVNNDDGSFTVFAGHTYTTDAELPFAVSVFHPSEADIHSEVLPLIPQAGFEVSGPVATFQANFVDVDDLRAEIDWGNGTTSTILGAGGASWTMATARSRSSPVISTNPMRSNRSR